MREKERSSPSFFLSRGKDNFDAELLLLLLLLLAEEKKSGWCHGHAVLPSRGAENASASLVCVAVWGHADIFYFSIFLFLLFCFVFLAVSDWGSEEKGNMKIVPIKMPPDGVIS
jgi:hypothetical protein